MLKIKVNHKIGDIVENRLTKSKFLIIGYEYIDGGYIRYICLESEKGDQKYLYPCELKPSKDREIGFYIAK